MKRLTLTFLYLFLVISLSAQTKLIKDLQKRHGTLQKQIVATEQLLKTTKKDVQGQLNHLVALNGQIEKRTQYIASINNDVHSIEGEVLNLSTQLQVLEKDLNDKKHKYQSSVYYIYKNKTIQEKLMFIFSANTLSQMYRRLRYMKEYATYQRLQGEEIQKRQVAINIKKNQLQGTKQFKVKMVKEGENQKAVLVQQQQEKNNAITTLQKKQRNLQSVISKKRREANQLNGRIDRLISIEIEKARKRAEEEVRQRRLAEQREKEKIEAREKAQEKERQRAAKDLKNKDMATNTRERNHRSEYKKKEIEKDIANSNISSNEYISSIDRRLSSNFENNRGRLPVPITGSYIIASHYGQYAVEGMHNVKLDNKGIDIQGHAGACARAIFGGEVSAVFQLNGLINILIRHGEYISVYCNLSSSSVRQGERIGARQILGRIFSDASDNNRTILHFQLRKERAKLNPEQWLGR